MHQLIFLFFLRKLLINHPEKDLEEELRVQQKDLEEELRIQKKDLGCFASFVHPALEV